MDQGMNEELRQRLRELGVIKGVQALTARPPRPSFAIEDLVELGIILLNLW